MGPLQISHRQLNIPVTAMDPEFRTIRDHTEFGDGDHRFSRHLIPLLPALRLHGDRHPGTALGEQGPSQAFARQLKPQIDA